MRRWEEYIEELVTDDGRIEDDIQELEDTLTEKDKR